MGKLLMFEHPKKSQNLAVTPIEEYVRNLDLAKTAYYTGLREYLKESCKLMEEIEQHLKSRNDSQ